MTDAKALDKLWKQPEKAFDGNHEVFDAVAKELRDDLEGRHASFMDHMMAERAASLYAHVRAKEAKTSPTGGQKSFDNDRAYKEVQALLISTLENIQRRHLREDALDAHEQAREQLMAGLDEALLDIDPDTAKQIRTTLVEVMT